MLVVLLDGGKDSHWLFKLLVKISHHVEIASINEKEESGKCLSTSNSHTHIVLELSVQAETDFVRRENNKIIE